MATRNPSATQIPSKLGGGDRRSIGRAAEVVRDVLAAPADFGALMEGILSDGDPVLRARCSDAAEKVSRELPHLLTPYTNLLLDRMAREPQREVRWHAAQMLARAHLTEDERAAAWDVLSGLLEDESSIVRTCALQALHDLAQQDAGRIQAVTALLQEAERSGTPAMRARARRLLRTKGRRG